MATDREGLERLIRYCARPPFALERLHLVDGCSDQILYLLPKPDPAGRTALRLSTLELLDRLATILPPPRIHRHRYHGVSAPNAPLRPLVTARALEDNAVAAEAPGPPLPLPTPTSPPLLHPAKGPPETELAMGPDSEKHDEAARKSFPDDLDQSPETIWAFRASYYSSASYSVIRDSSWRQRRPWAAPPATAECNGAME